MLDENLIAQLVRRKIVSDTFRRLQPDKKERVYQAAVRLFGTYGYDGMPVDRFCREAGISKGSFFQYFPSKSHLLEFVVIIFDDSLGRWIAEIRRDTKAVLARDRLLHLYHSILTGAHFTPSEKLFHLFVTKASAHANVTIEGINLERHLYQYIQEITKRGEQTGEIRGDIDIKLTAHVIFSLCVALTDQEYSGKPAYALPTGEQIMSLLFDGIQA